MHDARRTLASGFKREAADRPSTRHATLRHQHAAHQNRDGRTSCSAGATGIKLPSDSGDLAGRGVLGRRRLATHEMQHPIGGDL